MGTVSASQYRWGQTIDGRELCCRSTPILKKLSVEVNRVDGPGSKCPGSHYSIDNITKISHAGSEVRIDSAQVRYAAVYKNDDAATAKRKRTTPKWAFPRNSFTFRNAAEAGSFAEASQKLVAASPYMGHIRDLVARVAGLPAPSMQHLDSETAK